MRLPTSFPSRFAFLLPCLAACSEYDVKSTDGTADGPDGSGLPDIEVDPLEIPFGAMDVGSEDVTAVVTISNVGETDLQVSDISLQDGNAAFTLSSVTTPLVPAGGSAEFVVTFSPETAVSATDIVLIESDDPDEPVVEVLLSGDGIAPIIQVEPSEYDFGTLYVGCGALQAITISNVGNSALTVTAFNYNTGSNDLIFEDGTDTYGDLPWTISPGEENAVLLDVAYAPLDEYSDVAYLTVSSNDPYTPEVMAIQEGQGALAGENRDVFEQPINAPTDIIFAVDRSCSMYDDAANVANNMDLYVESLASLDADYQVAATVNDDGCIVGDDLYIDNTYSSDDAKTVMTTMIDFYGGYASNTERAFMLLESCLGASGSGDCNDGLVREDAMLNLVGVSDEIEQSVNPYSYYVSLFQSLKSDPDDVVFHAIGGDYPSGCGGNEPYIGFYEATVATGGLFLSICATDWGASMEALAEGSTADLDSFELSDWPVPETIVVTIDGNVTTEGWEYNATDNSVDFDEDHIPEGGSTIEVEYALYGDCGG